MRSSGPPVEGVHQSGSIVEEGRLPPAPRTFFAKANSLHVSAEFVSLAKEEFLRRHKQELQPLRHNRQSIRLRGHDYTQAGEYYVTLCVKYRESLLGEILRNQVELTRIGEIVKECWEGIPKHFSNAVLDEFVIMPNHMHGIVILVGTRKSVGTRHAVSQRVITPPSGEQFGNPIRGSLSTIIRSFKSAASNRIHSEGYSAFAWQSRFYEHIIRDAEDHGRIRKYIAGNVSKWFEDKENPEAFS
jgi:REP element-mobilizing transposase RayT